MPAANKIIQTSGEWSVKAAASRFSQLFNAALSAPQVVTRRKEDRVLVVSESALEKRLSAPNDLYGVICSLKSVPGLEEALQPGKPYKRRDLSL